MSKQFKEHYKESGIIVHVRKKTSGVYELRTRRDGKNISVSSKSLETAKEKFKNTLIQVNQANKYNNDTVIKAKQPTAAEYFKTWLDTVKKLYISTNTYHNYEKYFSTNLIQFFGDKALSEFSRLDLQKFINEYVKDGKLRTAKGLRGVLRELFNAAKTDGVITINPAETLRPIVYEQKHGRALSYDEENKIIEAIQKSGLETTEALLTLLLTGMRPIELKTATINLKENYFTVISAKQRKGQPIQTRNIPITPRAIRYLTFNKKLNFSTRQLEKDLKKITNKYTPYDFRHTFITHAKECGVPEDVVQIWVGHSRGKTLTGKVYTHYDDVYLQTQAKKISY